jgi:hypothetical protein
MSVSENLKFGVSSGYFCLQKFVQRLSTLMCLCLLQGQFLSENFLHLFALPCLELRLLLLSNFCAASSEVVSLKQESIII